jgi:diadenylate cyclase
VENLISTLASLREPRNLIDIAVIAFIVYQALRLIRGTRAWQMTFGVLALVVFYYMTRFLDLRAAQVFLETSFPYFIFSLVVVFQSEIRRALAEIGKGRILSDLRGRNRESGLDDIVLACTTLSGERIGALIVLKRDIGLKNYIESGTRLDARLNYDLLLTVFNPKSPLHDGAVIIADDRIVAAGCVLPLTTDPYLSRELGTRHRAAIGITEETDAVGIVVSEETGRISATRAGEITLNLDGSRLLRLLKTALELEEE